MFASKRLSQVFTSSKIIPFDDNSRFVIMSDCHRGNGSWGDNFSNNQHLFFAALNYYYDNGYTYLEIGDGDELWENRSMNDIISIHSNVFWLMSLFYRDGRLYMMYGNHDIIKRDPKFVKTICNSFYCDSTNSQIELFPDIEFTEGLILYYTNCDKSIFLTHGHQADFFNYSLWRIARFLVRYLWRPLELLGFKDPTSASKNYKKKNLLEKKLIQWSKQHNQMIICGHTHRPVFPALGEPLYFNDGSSVHPRCITAIEICNGFISLVKWNVTTKPNRTLYVAREVLEGPISLSDYF